MAETWEYLEVVRIHGGTMRDSNGRHWEVKEITVETGVTKGLFGDTKHWLSWNSTNLVLNELGLEGWELAGILPPHEGSGGVHFYAVDNDEVKSTEYPTLLTFRRRAT